ncbi:autotransporter domain-containing protein [Bradyrhizobium sp. Arg237L]|uniref:autotransporter outer membrane beta-barrel domain-containing protein n=1 Tax=Bradyrhizobium sp. Arg237L TaxID=3003352 RepID=UPI00249F18B7|nr:autotransporter domain-containing protein [Bradyrhizobium sp. Arg237L]MDI4235698.1 autotransporter domain-containing protein [Bradyrhizobium sp. Arg237L]
MTDRWNAVRTAAVACAAVIGSQFAHDVASNRVLAADVEITANTPSVDLDTFSGTTAHIANGVTVGSGGTAISATLQPWSLTNDGTVSGSNTIGLKQGGTITNNAGKTISGTLTAITFGYFDSVAHLPSGGAGALNNYGTITGGGGEGVTMWMGGTVNNYFGGTIKTETGLNAVSIGQGTSRTLFNSGTISATRTSGYSTGVLIQGGPSAFTNTGTGVIHGDFNGVYASASAAFTSFSNAGTIRSSRGSAAEIWGGGTVVNSGTIENLGSGSAADSNGILIRNNAAAEVTNSGTITGGVNAINFALAGGSPAGATHTLRLQTGSALNGNVVGGSGADNLILEGTGTENIARFQNFETLAMSGVDWTLSGSGTFSTSTTAQAGMLRVNGQLNSPVVNVQSGGALTGNGKVVGNVTNASGGNVRVDSGTLAFDGNYIHQMGAFFTVGVTPSSSGALQITGAGHTATLDGGTVRVFASPGNYAPNTQYTILTTTGGRTGAFSGASSNFAFLDPSLAYDANNVYLTLVRNSVDFAGIGSTPNQISAGRGLELLGMNNPMVGAALLLTPDQARAAFDSVSGEVYPSLHSLMVDESALLRDAILGRQRQDTVQEPAGQQSIALAGEDDAAVSYAKKARNAKAGPQWPVKAQPPVIAPVYSTWVQGYGNWTRLNGDGNAATLRSATGGAVGGVDVTLDHIWRFGVATGGGRTDARVDARLSSGTIDTFHIAAYGGGQIGDIVLRTGAAYSHHGISTTRMVAFLGFGDIAKANYSAGTAQIFGEAAHRLQTGWMTTEAFADLAYVRIRSDGFRETGGPAALTVAANDTSATFTTLGLRAQAPIPAPGPWLTTARGALGWQHAYDSVTSAASMSFAASPTPFAITSVPIARDALLVEAGLDTLMRQDMSLALLYTGRIATDASLHAVKVNVAIKF